MLTSHAMAHADAAWLRMDRPTNLMVITSAMWFDEPLDEARLRTLVLERLVQPYPRFRQRVVEGVSGAHWEDAADFDLDLHLHHLALPAPGDRAALERAVGDQMAQPLDRSRPLWSMTLLDGYRGGCALIVRMHHAIADGNALSRVMLGLTDAGAQAQGGVDVTDPRQPQTRLPFEQTARDVAGLARSVVHGSVDTLLHPAHLAALAVEGAADARALGKVLLAPTERQHPLHGPLGATQRAAWSAPIPLPDLREAGHAREATINDVLIACVAGAVRRHLLRCNAAAGDVTAMVPFNLRPLDEPLPRDLGNRFGFVILALPVGTREPVDRLREASRRMRAIKHSREAAVVYGLLGAIGRTPAALEDRCIDLFSSKATMVLTNVPGPRAPVFVCGVPVAGVLVWAPCSGAVGMSVSIFSYAGAVTVGFMVNGGLIDDPASLVEDFELEVQHLTDPERLPPGRR